MRDSAKEEIKRQATTQNVYMEPITGFTAGDAENHLENLHELYYRFSLEAVKDGYADDFMADIGHTYYVLWMFLKDITKNAQTFNELKASKAQQSCK